MKEIFRTVLIFWLIVSIIYSVGATFDAEFATEGGKIEDRLGLLVIQVMPIMENAQGETVNRWGYPISGDPGDFAIMIYNPFSTYFDDIIIRWDITRNLQKGY